jgi:hypothetical protein
MYDGLTLLENTRLVNISMTMLCVYCPVHLVFTLCPSTQHKAKVNADTQKQREQMVKELYNLRRSSGACALDTVCPCDG